MLGKLKKQKANRVAGSSFVTDASLSKLAAFDKTLKRKRLSFIKKNTDNKNEFKTLEFWLQGSYPVSENLEASPKRLHSESSEIVEAIELETKDKMKTIAIIEAFRTIKELSIHQICIHAGIKRGSNRGKLLTAFIESMVEDGLLHRTGMGQMHRYRLADPLLR